MPFMLLADCVVHIKLDSLKQGLDYYALKAILTRRELSNFKNRMWSLQTQCHALYQGSHRLTSVQGKPSVLLTSPEHFVAAAVSPTRVNRGTRSSQGSLGHG